MDTPHRVTVVVRGQPGSGKTCVLELLADAVLQLGPCVEVVTRPDEERRPHADALAALRRVAAEPPGLSVAVVTHQAPRARTRDDLVALVGEESADNYLSFPDERSHAVLLRSVAQLTAERDELLHAAHGRGLVAATCPCAGTPRQPACARRGCLACR